MPVDLHLEQMIGELKWGWKPMPYHWARRPLSDFITPEMRAAARLIGAKDWGLDPSLILYQNAKSHCVGDGWATWGNCPPVTDRYTQDDADKIYYWAVSIGGVPWTEEGATTEWGVKAMQKFSRLREYAWATSLDDMITWLLTNGPVVTGLMWKDGMVRPDAGGVMHATGGNVGGHETCWVGVDTAARLFKVANSWSNVWAQNGFAVLSFDDMENRMGDGGDCCTVVELPVEVPPAPIPDPPARPDPGCSKVLGVIEALLGLGAKA